jgi:hypothetical protein
MKKLGKIIKHRIKQAGGKKNFTGGNLESLLPTLTGPQKEQVAKSILNHENYLIYRGHKTACRLTIPLMDRKTMQIASQELASVAREIRSISRNSKLPMLERVLQAQNVLTMCGFKIKSRSNFDILYGIHGLR